MTDQTPAPSEAEQILTSLRAGIDPDTKQPHITWSEATARIEALIVERAITELEIMQHIDFSQDYGPDEIRGMTIDEYLDDRIAELKAALKDGGKQ